ncbi:hypothetical protein N752_05720 [Desulforamulus aquiferis]|nr:hypothetical protein [Desulforamulus aquiferis]RYD06146.1 hypothetical protein N752_05720 [Desulforamulus aquiferis]
MNQKLDKVAEIVARIKKIGGFKYGVAAGGSVADLIIGKKYGLDLQPRDIDVFVPIYSEEGISTKNVMDRLRKKGFVESSLLIGMEHEYRSCLVDSSLQVYKGKFNGFNVDVVAVNVAASDLNDYIFNKFDLTCKMAIHDGEKIITSPYFDNSLEERVIETHDLHNPITAYVMSNKGAEWICKVPHKYRHMVSVVEDLLRDYSPDITKVIFCDLARAWSWWEDEAPAVHRAFRTIALDSRREDRTIKDIVGIQNVRVMVGPSTKSILEFSEALKSASDTVKNIENLSEMPIVAGMSFTRAIEIMRSVSLSQFRKGWCKNEGRTIRIGKVLNALIKYTNQLKEDSTGEFYWKSIQKPLKDARCMLEGRLIEDVECRLTFSTDLIDLLSISTYKKWSSCQNWELGRVTQHNRHVLANLNGMTAVAILKNSKGDWMARAIIRASKDKRAVVIERVFGYHSDYEAWLVPAIEKELNNLGIKAAFADTADYLVGPFDIQPYNQGYDCYVSRGLKGGGTNYYLKPLGMVEKTEINYDPPEMPFIPEIPINDNLVDIPF